MDIYGFHNDPEFVSIPDFLRENLFGLATIYGLKQSDVRFTVMVSEGAPDLLVSSDYQRFGYHMFIALHNRIIRQIMSESVSLNLYPWWGILVKSSRLWRIYSGNIPIDELVPETALIDCGHDDVYRELLRSYHECSWTSKYFCEACDSAMVSLHIADMVQSHYFAGKEINPLRIAHEIFDISRDNWKSYIFS